MRFRYGEIAAGPHGPAIGIYGWGDDDNTLVVSFIAFTLYLKVPRYGREWDMERGYGFSFTDDGLHLHWNKKTKVLWYPWSWDFYRRWEWVEGQSYASNRGALVEVPRVLSHGQLATKHTVPYSYTLKRGEVQQRTATVYVDLMEWRWRWLKWLPFPRKRRQCISVEFNDEVGERTGSWKGGCLGCGYDMLEGETWLATLRRMERERRFT